MTYANQTQSDDLGSPAPQDALASGFQAMEAPVIGEAVSPQAVSAGNAAQSGSNQTSPEPPRREATVGSGGGSLLDTLIGQAAAAITVTAALIYGAGALTLALRLGFTHLPWQSVVGQLPYVLVLTSGFGQVILPAAIIGILGAVLLNYLINGKHEGSRHASRIQPRLSDYLRAKPSRGHFLAWLGAALIIGAAEAAISQPIFSYYKYHYYLHPGIMIAGWEAFLIVAALSAVAVGLALIGLPPPLEEVGFDGSHALHPGSGEASEDLQHYAGNERDQNSNPNDEKLKSLSKLSPWQWKLFVGMLVGFAAIPGVAAFSASTLFPYTQACWYSPGYGYLSGNLIGTNGGWAYMVEYRSSDYSHDSISAIPLSTVRMMSIGKWADCDTLSDSP
jgi:hypothetical protein